MTAHCLQLVDDRRPQIISSDRGGEGCVRRCGRYFCRVCRLHFLCLCFLFFLCFLLSLYRTFALCLELDLRRWQTVLVVAGTILQIAVNVVCGFGKTNLLGKGGRTLEVAHIHLEQFVELLDFLAARL